MYQQAYIEITNICNFRCGFCPSPTLERARAFMEPGIFAKLAPQLKSLVDHVYLHVLGEPLLHPLFADFISIAEQEALSVSITTNGSLLHRHSDRLLQSPQLRQINFSLHALREPLLPCDPEQVLESVLAFCLDAARQRPELYVNMRFWNLDSRESEEDPWTMRVRERLVQAFGVEWVPPIPGRRHRRLAEHVSVHQDSRFVWPGEALRTKLHEPRQRGFCQALNTHFAVLVDGKVVPCCLDAEGQIELGHSGERSLVDILQSPRATDMAAGFTKGVLVEELCRSCDYCRRFRGPGPRK